jgi:predicted DNA-binding transcriptional regulator AlpA
MSKFISQTPGEPFAIAQSFDSPLIGHGCIEQLNSEISTPVLIEGVNTLPKTPEAKEPALSQNEFSEDIIVIDLKRMKSLTGMSRTTIYRYCLDGQLPKPHRLGSGQNRWLLSDVRPYLKALVGKTQGAV